MGWSAGRDVDHPCGGQVSPWPASKVSPTGSAIVRPYLAPCHIHMQVGVLNGFILLGRLNCRRIASETP